MATPAAAIKKKPITRNRESLTCTECRSKKLKCDRQLPCSSCVKRNAAAACAYNKLPGRTEVAESTRSSRAEARLEHLEQLVKDLVESSQPDTATSNGTSNGASHVKNYQNGSNGSVYTGPTHHAAMLEDIAELRQFLGEQDMMDMESWNGLTSSSEADVLFGGAQALPLPMILSRYLPSRREADRRLALYFRAEGIAAPFIHVPRFHRLYEEFWANPYATSPLWTSMLFSIFHLSLRSGPDVPVESGHKPEYSKAAAHCLASGRYNRPQPFVVEALTTYIQVKLVECLALKRDLGMLMGVLVQHAFSMGYHRDPDSLKGISPFDGEMRRRVWSVIVQLDLLNAFQLGLPSHCPGGAWDTRCPGNYHDIDLDEDMTALPPPRPDTEVTKNMFYNAKHHLMGSFKNILSHAMATDTTNQEHELITLEASLRTTYDSFPPALQHKNVSNSITDPIMLIVTRRCIELMYEKCLCVLHRKHITSGRVASIRAAFDASRAIVTAFLDMYPEFRPGGQFYNDRWLLSSITWHDFLMGVMTMCLILCQNCKTPTGTLSLDDKRTMLRLLRTSQEVCSERAEESLSGRRTARLLQALLRQFDEKELESSQAPATSMTEFEESYASQPDIDMLFPDMNAWSSNVFENQEWAFLEEFLNTNFDGQ